jgi:hypothetical protein
MTTATTLHQPQEADESTATPTGQLRALGFGMPPWARTGEKTGENQWTYRADHLSPKSVRDLAFLLVHGWDVTIHARSSRVSVRVTRKATA